MKRGQTKSPASAAATLVILIGVFILLFVLLVEPETREELLGENKTIDKEDRFSRITGDEKTLLSASPGEVFAFERKDIKKELGSLELFSRINERTINLASAFDISKGFFGGDTRSLFFDIPNMDDLQALDLFFFIREASGDIKITLNNAVVFEGRVSSNDIPISLPVNLVTSANVIKISISSFSGSYRLSNIYLREKTLVENKQAIRTFELSGVEKSGLNKASLSYFVNCLSLDKRGVLTVELNNREIRKDFVICDAGQDRIELSRNILPTGTNRLRFSIDNGDYRIQDIEVNLELKEADFPKFTFNVEDDDFDKIRKECSDSELNKCFDRCDDDCETLRCLRDCRDDCRDDCREAKLIIEFTFGGDKGDRKKAAITINEEQFNFDVVDDEFARDISEFVRRGSNVIKVIPNVNFEIDHMRVFLNE